MPRGFELKSLRARLREPRVYLRLLLSVLLAANLGAALLAMRPPGGSAADLALREQQLHAQLAELQKRVARSRSIVEKVERARLEGDGFLERYTMDRRTTFSTIVSELARAAAQAGMKQRECSINLEPIEGSETLSQMTITCGYESAYVSLRKFMHLLDKSERFLIIEGLAATPQQSSGLLNVALKLDTFVKGAGGT